MNQLYEHRIFFNKGITQDAGFRKKQLQNFLKAIDANEIAIYDALYKDLKKSKEEVWVTEISIVRNEIKHAIKNLQNWMQPKRTSTNIVNLPSKSYVLSEPKGVVLIIAPWNYPFQLLFNPLVGAIAAGNCVALKASEFAPATDALMHKIITETFDANYISYYKGDGATVVPQLINNFTFDHIFYTGSTAVGKIIYKMAAENLVPVTLELGGKSPCVVDATANITIAAKRIAVAKFNNCGQMCVAPDYVLVHQSKKEELIKALQKTIVDFFTNDASTSYNYGKIINERQYNRLLQYLQQGTIVYGGATNKENLYIEPTLLTDVAIEDSVMKDEIFGPILPIITYKSNEEAAQIIAKNHNPLAFYLFSNSNKEASYWMQKVPFGGGCINNAAWHLTNHNLPFGGRGLSGSGNYHGKFSFATFSHQKAILKTPTWIDLAIKYPPLKGRLKLFKWLIR
jgi:aldehyde dehydrogenase (NAD+)